MAKPHAFKVGDIVKHKSAFLKSIGWCTNVPRNGRVTEGDDSDSSFPILAVEWCDGTANRIAACNIMLDGKPDYSGL